jgi:hypothetical protein
MPAVRNAVAVRECPSTPGFGCLRREFSTTQHLPSRGGEPATTPLRAGKLIRFDLGSIQMRSPRNIPDSAVSAGSFQHRALLAEFTE